MSDKWIVRAALLGVVSLAVWGSGVVPAIVPAAVPTANKIGNSSKFQLGTTGAVAGDCAQFDGSLNLTGPGTGGGCGGGGTQIHSVTIPISGSPIAIGTGNVGIPGPSYFPWTCTINRASTVGNVAGSITVDIWKANAAIPSVANKISASAPVTLSSAQINQSSALTGWTTAAVSGDVFWASVATVDGVLGSVSVQLTCQ